MIVRLLSRALVLIACVALLLTVGLATAQEIVDIDVNGIDEVVDVNVNQNFEIDASNFDQWVFGVPGANTGEIKDRIRSMLTIRCETIDALCKLSESQRQKLELAGEGDIERFFRRVEQVRVKFMAVRRDQQKFNLIWQEINPIQNRVNANFFNQESLFSKTVHSTLNADQAKQYDEWDDERRLFRFRAKVELVVTELESGVPLTDEQRTKVIQLILDAGPMPKRFGSYDVYLVFYRMSCVDEEVWKKLLDAEQFKMINLLRQQGRQMEATLVATKVIDDPNKKPAPPKPAAAAVPAAQVIPAIPLVPAQ